MNRLEIIQRVPVEFHPVFPDKNLVQVTPLATDVPCILHHFSRGGDVRLSTVHDNDAWVLAPEFQHRFGG